MTSRSPQTGKPGHHPSGGAGSGNSRNSTTGNPGPHNRGPRKGDSPTIGNGNNDNNDKNPKR